METEKGSVLVTALRIFIFLAKTSTSPVGILVLIASSGLALTNQLI